MTDLERKIAAGGVGLLAGYLVYQAQSAPVSKECSQAFPGASQSLLQALAGAAQNTAEDAELGQLSLVDKVTAWASGGLLHPTFAADFYSWWNGLTPDQQAAVQNAEPAAISCAARETAGQTTAGISGLVAGLVAGVVAFEVIGAH